MPTQPYYLADDTRVPGVTTIIGKRKDPGGLIHWAWECGTEGVDYRKARDTAADAGTLAHAMIDEHIHGRDPEALLAQSKFEAIGKKFVVEGEIAEKARMAFKGFLGWERQSQVEWVATEMPLVSEEYRFGGCPDAVGRIGGLLVMVDFKTGRTYPDHLVQLAAYRHLWNVNRDEEIKEAHLCRFDKEYGTFTHKQMSGAMLDVGWETFRRLREVYELDKELGKMAK